MNSNRVLSIDLDTNLCFQVLILFYKLIWTLIETLAFGVLCACVCMYVCACVFACVVRVCYHALYFLVAFDFYSGFCACFFASNRILPILFELSVELNWVPPVMVAL